MRIDPERQRKRAAALAETLLPLLDEHQRVTAAFAPPPRPDPFTRDLLAACESVEKAVNFFEQAKFTPSEIKARRKVMESAMKVRTLMRKRKERRNGR